MLQSLNMFLQVFYLEACEAGSIFEGLLPSNLNIYATTASNADESSWAAYCPEDSPGTPQGYDTCLGDIYSISWMEDRYANFVIIIMIIYSSSLFQNIVSIKYTLVLMILY